MNSAYDNIKKEHQFLLDDLARLVRLFKSIPLVVSTPESSAKSVPPLSALTPPVVWSGAQPQTVTAALAESTPVWPELGETKAQFKIFTEALLKHFDHEVDYIFTGMLMTMPTKVVCQWVMSRVSEHGVIKESIENLLFMLVSVEPPLSKRWYKEIAGFFERIRAMLLAHAVEEDSKYDLLLRNNPAMLSCIKKLIAQNVQTR